MTLCHAALAALLFATSLAQAAPPAGPTPAAPLAEEPGTPTPAAVADPPADEKVCKLERQLGSNKMKRVCHSRAELDRQGEAAREALSREQRR